MKPLLSVQGVHKKFGATIVLSGVQLEVAEGERHALIGPNGAGKSTLFNLISGRLPADAGVIRLGERDITRARPWQIHRLGLARSFQISSLFEQLSVYENLRVAALAALGVRAGFWRFIERIQAVRERADEVLELLGLQAERDRLAGALSHASQRALEIGITLASRPAILLLDEPTSGMSRAEADATMALIRRVTAGRTLLLIEHDMQVVFGLADRISVLDRGERIAVGTPAQISANELVRAAYLGASPC
jgi:branched-chain amino acid transport system ATP-binding protein